MKQVRYYITCPMCSTPEQAVEWFHAQGATEDIRLWRAEDGSVRGRALVTRNEEE